MQIKSPNYCKGKRNNVSSTLDLLSERETDEGFASWVVKLRKQLMLMMKRVVYTIGESKKNRLQYADMSLICRLVHTVSHTCVRCQVSGIVSVRWSTVLLNLSPGGCRQTRRASMWSIDVGLCDVLVGYKSMLRRYELCTGIVKEWDNPPSASIID